MDGYGRRCPEGASLKPGAIVLLPLSLVLAYVAAKPRAQGALPKRIFCKPRQNPAAFSVISP